MKNLRRIIPIILILCLAFSTTAFGAVTKPGKVKITSVAGDSIGVTVKFKPQGNSIWYKLYYSEDEDFGYRSVYTNKTGSVFQPLDANKTYYIKMRAYKEVNGKRYWGPYSNVYTVTTKNPKPEFLLTLRKLTSNVFAICAYPSDFGYPVTLDLNSAYVFDATTGEILSKLIPDMYTNTIAGTSSPEYKRVEDNSIKINNGYIGVVSLKAKTGNYYLDETKYGILCTGKYNGKDYIFRTTRNGMDYMKINWKNGYTEK